MRIRRTPYFTVLFPSVQAVERLSQLKLCYNVNVLKTDDE